MKVLLRLYITSIICALVLGSGQMAFAQKGNGLKYVPEVVTKKTVPYVVNPKLSPAARRGVAAFSGAAVERAAATATQRGALSTSAVRMKGNSPTGTGTKMPPASLAEKPNFNLPGLSADTGAADIGTNIGVVDGGADMGVVDSGTNLTGVQVLQTYFPAWRQELGGMFSPAQLDAVERTFAATDDWMFVRGEDGELQIRNKDEWDYEARFLTLLQDSGVSFTEKQINKLIGGAGIKGFTFKIYFFRMKATGFSCAKGTKPRKIISKDGRILLRKEMTPQEVQEIMVGQGLHASRNHPLVKAYMMKNRLQTKAKTPKEYVDLAQQYPTKPRAHISRGGHILSRKEMTPEEIHEVMIGRGLYNHRNHPLVQAYLQKNLLKAENKTAKEYVDLAQQYPTKPRAVISRNGRILLREEMTPEEIQEVNIGNGLHTHRNHPLVKAYLDKNRLIAEAQTTQQLYTALITHIKNYGHYPMDKESSLRKNIYTRLHYHKFTMTDGKYADPWLQKIYELKTAIQNAPEGKFTLTPDGQGGYILEIEEPAAEETDVTAPHQIEEPAPAVPLPHALRLRITEDIKNMVLATRDQAALERHEFYPWLRFMQQNHADQIINTETWNALWAISRALAFDHRTGQNRRVTTYLLQTVNNYVGVLGEDQTLGYFNKLIYRGQLEPGMLPQADKFHVVAEQHGMSWDGDVVPQVGKVNRTYIQAIKRGENPGVFLDGDEDRVTAIGIAPRVDIQTVKQDLEDMLAQLLPPGFEVRMGLHELGVVGSDMTKFRKGHLHLHLEHPATAEEIEDGFSTDISIRLNVKAGRFAGWMDYNVNQFYPYSDQVIAERYRTLFDAFLDQEAKDKLDELAQ